MRHIHALSLCVSSLVIGCMPPGYYGADPASANGTAAVAPDQPADTRDPGQKFVDAIANDYSCQHDDNGWLCRGKAPAHDPHAVANWPFYVYFAPASDGVATEITLSSTDFRAFGVTCARFQRYTDDLYDTRNGFSAKCSDEDKEFYLNTVITFQPDALTDSGQAGAWVTQFLSNRITAWKLLRSVGAIRQAT